MFAGTSVIEFNLHPRGTHRFLTNVKSILHGKLRLHHELTLEVQCMRTPSWGHIGPEVKHESKWNWFHSTERNGVLENCEVLFD